MNTVEGFLRRQEMRRRRVLFQTPADIEFGMSAYPVSMQSLLREAYDLHYAILHYEPPEIAQKKQDLFELCTQLRAMGFEKEARILFNGPEKQRKHQ